MIKEVVGDLLLSSAQVLAHGVAPGDHFNQGLAQSLREKWPSLYDDFRHYCHVHSPEVGSLWMWGTTGGTRVVNLLTQEAPESHTSHPGRAKVEYVNHALRELHKLAEKEKFTSIALPRLATGVGGLEWSEVKPLVEKHLGSLNIPIYIYTEYKKDVVAPEK